MFHTPAAANLATTIKKFPRNDVLSFKNHLVYRRIISGSLFAKHPARQYITRGKRRHGARMGEGKNGGETMARSLIFHASSVRLFRQNEAERREWKSERGEIVVLWEAFLIFQVSRVSVARCEATTTVAAGSSIRGATQEGEKEAMRHQQR